MQVCDREKFLTLVILLGTPLCAAGYMYGIFHVQRCTVGVMYRKVSIVYIPLGSCNYRSIYLGPDDLLLHLWPGPDQAQPRRLQGGRGGAPGR